MPPPVSTRTVLATLLGSVDEYVDEDGNMSMKIRLRFRDIEEIRSLRRLISAALPRHGEKTSAKSPWPVAPHELEGEAEERRQHGAGGRRRRRPAAARRRRRRRVGMCVPAGSRGNLCVFWGSPAHVYIGGFWTSPTRSLFDTY